MAHGRGGEDDVVGVDAERFNVMLRFLNRAGSGPNGNFRLAGRSRGWMQRTTGQRRKPSPKRCFLIVDFNSDQVSPIVVEDGVRLGEAEFKIGRRIGRDETSTESIGRA